MEENYLMGLILCFFFGMVFFKKENKIDIGSDKVVSSARKGTASTSSGVAKYIQKQQGDSLEEKVTGVARYLESKIQEETEEIQSGVAKYLETKEQVQVTSVSRYMARQAIQENEKAKMNISSVEKYLNKHG